MSTQETFGQWLRRIRTQCKMKQAALAAETGITQSAISQLENDKFTPDDLTLEKIKHTLTAGIQQPTLEELEHINKLLLQAKDSKKRNSLYEAAGEVDAKCTGSKNKLIRMHKRLAEHHQQQVIQLSSYPQQPEQ
ncbi:helix-turn-helix domain-containing protein [Larkinella sp. VNQ87]|uniref:helix-turn-helix domain-containing protein n=1 Tax=Larkinella sp. VNQ87 TaxID=3400921 RepID=UPI003C0AA90E